MTQTELINQLLSLRKDEKVPPFELIISVAEALAIPPTVVVELALRLGLVEDA